MIEKIDSKLIELLKNEAIAISCSGGSDSMALLHFAQNNFNNISVINFEHGIRGDSSISDSEFVREYCKKNNIKCEVVKLDTLLVAKQLGLTVEESARKLRYDYYKSQIEQNKVKYILLAHHKLDQVETVLMRIFRGTGIDGLEGIKVVNNGIVRPLLNVSKEEILEYIKANNITYVEDETNSDTLYTRNFIRHKVLPLIKEKYPKVEDSICRLATISQDINAYFDSNISVTKLSENTVQIPIDLSCLELFRRNVKRAYEQLGINQDIEFRHYELIADLVNKPTATTLDMPFNTVAVKEYNSIIIAKKQEEKNICILLEQVLNSELLQDKVRFSKVNGKFDVKDGLYFDMDKMPKDAVIRYRKQGDTFTKFGGGTKSLGDFLTDKKVPVRLRDKLLVVASKSDVLLVAGVAISDKIKVNDNSQNIYKITTEKNNGI